MSKRSKEISQRPLEIRFHHEKNKRTGKIDPYFAFSNQFPLPFIVKAKRFASTGHYVQYKKFAKSGSIRPDWGEIREEVMRKAIQRKFAQNESLAWLLLNTHDAILMDDSHFGTGENMLGKILMAEREALRMEKRRKLESFLNTEFPEPGLQNLV